MRDIDIKCDDGNFKLRVSAIIIKNDKLLVEDSRTNEGYYSFTGGHVELGELASETIKREIKEEVQIDAKIKGLYCVLENAFVIDNRRYQEINYFYKLEPLEELPDYFETKEIDKGVSKHHKFQFIPIKEIKNLRPTKIVDLLKENTNYENLVVTIDERNKQ